jgi:hypothetical protein
MFMKTTPGDQVIVIPDWVMKTLSKKGKVEDLVNFSKMRQWFTQEQLIAMDRFSDDGLTMFWTNGSLPAQGDNDRKYTTSLGYNWYFPHDVGQSDNGTEADTYAKDQISRVKDNREYSEKLVNDYVLDYFKQPGVDKIDLSQSYSVYSSSSKLIVVALNQGCMSPIIYNRKEELRLSILRSIVGKLQMYYDLNVVHKTNWFGWYLTELEQLK